MAGGVVKTLEEAFETKVMTQVYHVGVMHGIVSARRDGGVANDDAMRVIALSLTDYQLLLCRNIGPETLKRFRDRYGYGDETMRADRI